MVISDQFRKALEVEKRKRMDSESSTDSDFAGLEHLTPLELEDIEKFCNRVDDDGLDEILEDLPEVAGAKFFTVAMNIKRKLKGLSTKEINEESAARARRNWKKAYRLVKTRRDSWEMFHLDELPAENAIRHRYNSWKNRWTRDYVVVKMDKASFNHGAMRECFRLKKLSNFIGNGNNWNTDSNNYVAKRYMDESVENTTYFDDVKLQMDAKLWGEEYNRHNPPKKVDIFQMAVLEMHERKGKPLFHIEHFIEGDYVKYNSNSGFVDNRICRQTPHAFSHFTFERSGHELIVVDVQGVGDLYTDPQIHTSDGEGYGDGNLGTKGMALFFHSHSCNSICKKLQLTPFDLAINELGDIEMASSCFRSTSVTVLRGNELICGSPSSDFANYFHQRSGSLTSIDEGPMIPSRQRYTSDYVSSEELTPPSPDSIMEHEEMHHVLHFPSDIRRARRSRYFSECSEDSGIRTKELDKFFRHNSRPSCVQDFDSDSSILGQIHFNMALYHEVLRFVEESASDYDHNAALFHLKSAADCGVLPAIIAYARLHLDLPSDVLATSHPDCDGEERLKIGLKYLQKAAEHKDRTSLLILAHAYDHGQFGLQKNLTAAVNWYELIEETDNGNCDSSENTDWGMDDPPYAIQARLADIYMSGFDSTPRDPAKAGDYYNSAAESAMACMKGKLANKYYMLAEEAWGEASD